MNKTITQIYADDSLLVLTGDEKIEMEDPNDSDATKGTTTAAIAALAGVPVSLGDNDISSSNATLSMTTPNTQAVGYRFIVSWHSGDGSNNFQFTDLGSITLNGILMSTLAIKGEGQGYWQLRKTAVNTWVTDGMPEIWDSDGGNFTGYSFEKTLSGKLTQRRALSANIDGTNNFPIDFVNTTYTPLVTLYLDTSASRIVFTDTEAVGSFEVSIYTTAGVTANSGGSWEVTGRWTTGHPRKV